MITILIEMLNCYKILCVYKFRKGLFVKNLIAVIRILVFILDCMIIMIPIQLITIGIFGASVSQAELLNKLLFATYATLFTHYFHGATLGKYLGKVKVISSDGEKIAIAHSGMRELIKTLYFIPVIGWSLGLISLIMIFWGEGRTIHDRIAGTRVVVQKTH